MSHEACLRMGDPFTPKIRLTNIVGMISVDVGTGIDSKRLEPCLICDKQISEGFDVVLDNGMDDRMHVGYCCSDHPQKIIPINAIAKVAELLRARAAAAIELIDVANSGGIEVVEV